MKSYIKRRIELTFLMGEGKFGEDGTDTVELKGLRVNAAIEKAGAAAMGMAHLRVYGMKMSTMNKLSTLGLKVSFVRKNYVTVKAGDDEAGMTTVFKGLIQDAYEDFNAQPDACFNVVSQQGSWQAIKPVPPSSFQGSVDVATALKGMAERAGLDFENHGVDVKLQNPYFPGTARTQIVRAAEAADINFVIDKETLAIWPKGKTRGDQAPLISPQSGLRGYPCFTSNGISLTTLFMPHVEQGGPIEVKSSLTPACGKWVVQNLYYNLESETPHGPWFMQIEAGRVGDVAVRQ